MASVYEKERELQREVSRTLESGLPGVEVLAVELSGPERFTVFVDHPKGVDHALCQRVTDALGDYLRTYSVDVSSPGMERPLRRREHFRNAVGRRVALRTQERRRVRGEVVEAGARTVTVHTENENVEVPYDAIVRGNLIDEGTK
ncbi:MAG: ribosome maturation factor RimP [Actinobacteria bacterium]|nr:ribosome maturation factor RimP [Actinomycetota bacterium]